MHIYNLDSLSNIERHELSEELMSSKINVSYKVALRIFQTCIQSNEMLFHAYENFKKYQDQKIYPLEPILIQTVLDKMKEKLHFLIIHGEKKLLSIHVFDIKNNEFVEMVHHKEPNIFLFWLAYEIESQEISRTHLEKILILIDQDITLKQRWDKTIIRFVYKNPIPSLPSLIYKPLSYRINSIACGFCFYNETNTRKESFIKSKIFQPGLLKSVIETNEEEENSFKSFIQGPLYVGLMFEDLNNQTNFFSKTKRAAFQ